jgi:hypothetical protein
MRDSLEKRSNHLANETLYQLSYTPEIFGKPMLKVQNLVCISTGGPPVLPP